MKKVFKFYYQVPFGGGVMYIAADSASEAIDICAKQKPPDSDGKWIDDTEAFERAMFQMKFTAGNTDSGVLDIETWTE